MRPSILQKTTIVGFVLLLSTISYAQILTHTKEIGLSHIKQNTVFIRDTEMLSPKSADFIGNTLVINAFERGATLYYDIDTWKKLPSTYHQFNHTEVEKLLVTVPNFPYVVNKQSFTGKPVEITYNQEKMWIPYYRLSWDTYSRHGAAMAQVDIKTHKVEKIIPTGSIPKMVQISPDNKTLVATHWGDNTVGIYTMDNNNITNYHHVIIDSKLNTSNITGDRDTNCGFCLRGTVFTPDNKYILVARMGGGGIAVINKQTNSYIGTIRNVPLTPRHLVQDGNTLYISTCFSGEVAKISMESIMRNIQALENKAQKSNNIITIKDWQTLKLGSSVRTIALSRDNKFIYAALNDTSEIAVIDNTSMKVLERHKVASFPVGLAVSQDDRYIALTSQGKSGKAGGNHIDIFERK